MRFRFLVAAALFLTLPLHADVVKIVVDDLIHPITDEYIGRALDDAKKNRDDAVLIELRTPGGLEPSTRTIVEKILASPVPVIVYIAPSGSRAASAGFFILEAADIAAMAPGTNTGAAHPVILGVEKIDDIMKQKLENDSAAFMRSIASRRGRNVAVAESAVRQSKSFTEDEALSQKLIDIVASSEARLLEQLDGRTVNRFHGGSKRLELRGKRVRVIEMTLKQKILSFIMDPNVAFLLFSLGMLALWAEFNHPGAILPGVIGLVSILLAVFALNILPTRYAAVALILAAFLLFVLEAKYTSHGILGAGGVICMMIGAMLLVDGPVPEMRVHWITALAVSLPFGIITIFLMSLAIQAHKQPVVTGEEGLIGEVGVAETSLDPEGHVFVHGERWNAIASTPVPAGSKIVVRGIDGFRLKVEPERASS